MFLLIEVWEWNEIDLVYFAPKRLCRDFIISDTLALVRARFKRELLYVKAGAPLFLLPEL